MLRFCLSCRFELFEKHSGTGKAISRVLLGLRTHNSEFESVYGIMVSALFLKRERGMSRGPAFDFFLRNAFEEASLQNERDVGQLVLD